MNDAPERSRPEQEPAAAPYMRLPMPLVALALFVFLAVLLGIGLWANRNLRPQGIVLPTPLPEASATPAPPVAAAGTPAATAQAVVVATATAAPTPLILALTASSTPEPGMPTASAIASRVLPSVSSSPIPTPTVDPDLAREVGEAYVTYWRVRSQALLDLDATHLAEVMDGEYLQSFQSKLMDLAGQGRAIKTQVSLNYKVVQANKQTAIVIDRIEDDSYYVKAGSEEALSDPANDVLRLEVKLSRVENVWKVVESVSAD